MTSYVILTQSGGMWAERGEAEASSARRAIAATDPDEGVYVAVPKRSWKPLTVKVETSRKLTIT